MTVVQATRPISRFRINEVRDDFSRQHYGRVFSALTEEQQKIVKEAVPQNISEAEPKDVTKK